MGLETVDLSMGKSGPVAETSKSETLVMGLETVVKSGPVADTSKSKTLVMGLETVDLRLW